MYGDIIQDLREGLAVSAEHDDTILRGIQQAARQLLKTYNFPKSVRLQPISIAGAADNVTLPVDCGKIKAVHLTTTEGSTKMYKPLFRRGAGLQPTYQGPNTWEQVGLTLKLDQPMPAILPTPYFVEVWYQSTDEVWAEPWLSVDYQDAIEHLAGSKLALKKRKKEAAEIYSQLWMQDVKILATFVTELEYSTMDMAMGDTTSPLALDRYPAQ